MEVRLASASPVERAKAALALGAAYEQGAPLAHLLAVVAMEDPDATVRTVAAEAVETLAVTASGRLLAWLTECRRKPYEHLDYRAIVGEVTRLGPLVLPMDIAAGHQAVRTDAGRADALATTLLAMRPAPDGFLYDILGLDALLADVAAKGGPLASAMARDCLVVLSCSQVRRAGRGARPPAPAASEADAAWLRLLDAKKLTWFSESALVVIPAAGRPGPAVIAWLAEQHCFEALGTLGEAAAAAADRVSRERGDQTLRPWAMRRLGRREGLLPETLGATTEQQLVYARGCAGLAVLDPELVGPARANLESLLRDEAPAVRRAALLALARIRGSGRTFYDLHLSDGRGWGDAALHSLARLQDPHPSSLDILEALQDAVGAEGERLRDLEPFLRECRRTLATHAGSLRPIQDDLEALLTDRLLPSEARVAILRAVVRIWSAAQTTLAAIEKMAHEEEEFASKHPSGYRADLPVPARTLKLGSLMAQNLDERRATAAALAALVPRAEPDRTRLERWAKDEDAIVRHHARRALAKLAAR